MALRQKDKSAMDTGLRRGGQALILLDILVLIDTKHKRKPARVQVQVEIKQKTKWNQLQQRQQ